MLGNSLLQRITLHGYGYLFLTFAITGIVYYLYLYLYRPLSTYQNLLGAKGAKYFKVPPGSLGSPREQLRGRLRNESGFTKPPLYPNGWFGLLESSDIGVNQVKHVLALGENFAVFRDSNGKVHVVDAHCYLGADMGIGGEVKDDCPQCPCHGCQFDGETGQCTTIQHAEKVPEYAKVQTWQSKEVNHIIFVWYHADGEAPSYQPEPIEEIMNGDYRFAGRNEFLFDAHIEDAFQNGADFSHFQTLHIPATMGENYLDGFKKSWFSTLFKLDVHQSWTPDPDQWHLSHIRNEMIFRFFNRKIVSITSIGKQIGPGYEELSVSTSLGSLRGTLLFTPVKPFVLRASIRWYTKPLGVILGRWTVTNTKRNGRWTDTTVPALVQSILFREEPGTQLSTVLKVTDWSWINVELTSPREFIDLQMGVLSRKNFYVKLAADGKNS